MTPIKKFCSDRLLSQAIEDAFIVYCRTTYARKFELLGGDTVSALVNKLDETQVNAAWLEFIEELRLHLISQQKIA